MPKDKKPYIELHDAHVTAALDDRSEQHFRWMMEQDRPEHSENVEDWFNFYIERMNEIERVKHGPCEDETRRLNALRKLEASLKKHIATDPYTFNAQTVTKHQQAAKVPTEVERQRRVEELEARREKILADRRKLFETQAAVQKKIKKGEKKYPHKVPPGK
jgi:hypothetical protein